MVIRFAQWTLDVRDRGFTCGRPGGHRVLRPAPRLTSSAARLLHERPASGLVGYANAVVCRRGYRPAFSSRNDATASNVIGGRGGCRGAARNGFWKSKNV